MQQKSLKKNAFLNAFKTFLGLCFPLITFPYSSRVLGPDSLGKVNFAQSIVSYFSMIAWLGIQTYAIREAARVRDDKASLSKIVKEIFTINLISTAVSYGFLAVSLLLVKKFACYRELIIICATLIMFETLGLDWLYTAMEDYVYRTVRSMIFQVISVILLFVLVKTKDDYLKYAAINVVSNAGANICNFIHARKYISFKTTGRLELRRHLKPVFVFFFSYVASTIFSHIDTTMLGFLKGDTEVGFYSAALKIITMIRNLIPAVLIVLFPRISYYISRNNMESIRLLVEKTVNAVICFTLPMMVGLILLMEPLVTLFCGEKYYASVLVAQVMTPYIMITALSGFIGGTLCNAFGKEKIALYVVLFSMIFDVVLNSLLIPRWGAYGAALATLFTELVGLIFYSIYQRRLLKTLAVKKCILQFVLSTAIMGCAVYFVRGVFENRLLTLFAPTFTGIAVYALILVILKNEFFISEALESIEKMKTWFKSKIS